MKPYAPGTSKGRTVAVEDVHHRTADQPREAANAAAKALRHSARQDGQKQVETELTQEGNTMSQLHYPKVVVLCTNANGEPEFHSCTPEVTQQQIDDGVHYDLAKENAGYNGYSEPMMAFDAKDQAAKDLSQILGWLDK
ncbi:hypothetical protein G3A43_06375 [Paraburkholderia aspalathi]|nr:hypothetical protein [Paraburkholderia aspalathi]MBK3779874.1 hypothetical protein [Paraburkholderia aspalathi]